MEEILQAIANYGFSIVMSVVLLCIYYKSNERHREIEKNFTDAINKNTDVLAKNTDVVDKLLMKLD